MYRAVQSGDRTDNAIVHHHGDARPPGSARPVQSPPIRRVCKRDRRHPTPIPIRSYAIAHIRTGALVKRSHHSIAECGYTSEQSELEHATQSTQIAERHRRGRGGGERNRVDPPARIVE